MEIPVELVIKIKAFLGRIEDLPQTSQIKEIAKSISSLISESGTLFQKDIERILKLVEELKKIKLEIPGIGKVEEFIKLVQKLVEYKPKKVDLYVPGAVPEERETPELWVPKRRRYTGGRLFDLIEKEREQYERYRTSLMLKGLELPTVDLQKIKVLYSIYNQIFKKNVDIKEAQEFINRLSQLNVETLKDILKRKQSIIEILKQQTKEKEKQVHQTKRETEETEKQIKVKSTLTKEEIRRTRLLDIINQYYKDPYISKYLNTLGDINKKSTQELQVILNKIYALRIGSNILYRQRLEWDRIGNTLRYVGMVFTGMYTAGIRNAAYFAVEVLRGKGALQLTTEQAVALNYIGRVLGVTFTDLIQGIGNVYQALINAGQGTSFVAERVREALNTIGISAFKLGQQMLHPYDLFWKTILALKELEVTLGRSWVAQKLLGTEFEKLAPFLALSREQLIQLKTESEDFAKSLGINAEDIHQNYMKFALLVEQLRLYLIAFFLDLIKASGDFFKELRNRTNTIIEVWKELPQSMKIGINTILLLIGPGSLILGSIIRFGDNIQRVIMGLAVLRNTAILTFKTLGTMIASSNPVLLALLTVIYLVTSALAVFTQRREQFLKKENEQINKAEEVIGKYWKILQDLKREEEKGFKSSIISADELEKKLLDLRKQQLQLEKEGKGLEAYKVWGKDIVDILKKVEKEIQEVRKERMKYLLTEDDIKKKLSEIEIQIKEQNLPLSEQYKLYNDLYNLAVKSQVKEELINQILEKRTGIIQDALKSFQELSKELERPVEDIPFLKSFIDGIAKLKDYEDKLLVLRQSKSVQEVSKYEDLLQKYRLNLRKKFSNELNEEEIKTLKELAQTEVSLGKWNLENYYKAITGEEKRHLLEREALQRWGEELILKVSKEYPEELVRVKDLLNLKLQALEKKHIANIKNIWNEVIENRISLYKKEDEKYSTILKSRELSERQLTELYSRRMNLLENLIQEISKLPDSEAKHNALLDLQNRKLELSIDLENNRNSLYDKEYSKIKKIIDAEEDRFQKIKHTTKEEIEFYNQLYLWVSGLNISYKARERILNEVSVKIRKLEQDNFEFEKELLSTLTSLYLLSYSERVQYLNEFIKREKQARERGYITYLDEIKDITSITTGFIKAEFESLKELKPLVPIRDTIYSILDEVYNKFLEFKDDLKKVSPEERFIRFNSILNEIFSGIKDLGLTSGDIEKIFNTSEFQNRINSLVNLFNIPPEQVKKLLENLRIQFSGEGKNILNLLNSLKDNLFTWVKDFGDRSSTIKEKTEKLFISISKEFQKYFVEEFLNKLPIKEKLQEFYSKIQSAISEGKIDFKDFGKMFIDFFQNELNSIKDLMSKVDEFLEEIDLKERALKRISDLRNSIQEGFTSFIKEFGQGVVSISLQVQKLMINITKQIYNFLIEEFIDKLGLKEKIKEFVSSIQDSFKTGDFNPSTIIQKFKEFSTGTINTITSFFSTLKNFLEELNIQETLLNLKRNLFDEILNAFSEFARNVLLKGEEIKQALENLKIAIAEALLKFIVEQILITKLFTQQFKEQLSVAIDLALTGNYKLLNNLISDFARKVEGIIPFIERITRNIMSAFGIQVQSVKNETQEMLGSLDEEVREIEDYEQQVFTRFQRLLQARERFREGWYSRRGTTVFSIFRAGTFGGITSLTPYSKTMNVNFYGLSFNEQRKVFDFWQDREELSEILGVSK